LSKTDFYDELAKVYDDVYSEKKMKIRVQRNLEEKLIEKCHGVSLDVGCGTGRHLRHFGIDISQGMLLRAKGKGILVRGSSEYLPFKDESFDCVYAFFGSLNHSNIVKSLREISRVMKRGGKFFATIHNRRDALRVIKSIIMGKKPKIKRKGKIRLVIGGKTLSVWTKFYTREEIERLLPKCGLSGKVYGSLLLPIPLPRDFGPILVIEAEKPMGHPNGNDTSQDSGNI